MDIKFEDMWDNLTIVIPGMVTYGAWRILILASGYDGIDFAPIDDSSLLTASVIFAFAIIQQVFGITFEMVLCLLVWPAHKLSENRFKFDYMLLVDRFRERGRKGHKKAVSKRMAQFFMSMNVAFGQLFILLFIILEIKPSPPIIDDQIFRISLIITILSVVVMIFRYWNAREAIIGEFKNRT